MLYNKNILYIRRPYYYINSATKEKIINNILIQVCIRSKEPERQEQNAPTVQAYFFVLSKKITLCPFVAEKIKKIKNFSKNFERWDRLCPIGTFKMMCEEWVMT